MTAHHPNFVQVIQTLKPLLRTHKPLCVMPMDDLLDWCSWYWNRGTMAYAIDNNGPQGVCLIKLFRRLAQFMDHNIHDPCGEFVMLELLAANHPLAIEQVCETLCDRWGPQKIVMWDRGERTENGAPRMYNWNKFRQLARRLSYGLR